MDPTYLLKTPLQLGKNTFNPCENQIWWYSTWFNLILTPGLSRLSFLFSLWRKAQGKKLVAPAITSSGNQGQGISWLDQFIDACSGCTFDGEYLEAHRKRARKSDMFWRRSFFSFFFLLSFSSPAYAFHPYAASATDVINSAAYFTSYQNGKYTPAWITEFGRDASTVNNGGGAQFITDVINAFEGSAPIQRYAYIAKIAGSFNAQRDLQVDESSTQLTDLGNAYQA